MAFTEKLKAKVRKRAHHRCCVCKAFGVEIHHIVPQEEKGADTEDNAAPLCPSCHETYGANKQKRKMIREARDDWYEICEKRYAGDEEQIRQALGEHIQPVQEGIDDIKATLATMSPKQEPEPGDTEIQRKAKEIFNKGFDAGMADDHIAARAYFDSVIHLDSNFELVFYNRGLAKSKLGDKKGAIDDYTESIRIDSNYANAFYNRGNAKSELGDYEGAINDYTEAIHIDPNYAKPFYNRGLAKSELGDNKDAINDYTEAIRIDPTYAKPYYNRGIAKSELGDNEGAKADYQEALRLDPSLPPPPKDAK